MDGCCFVRISRAIGDMEIIPAAISRKLGGGFVACTNCRAQTLDVLLGCSPQRIRHLFDEGFEPRGKAPADLLMNTEDDVIVGRIDTMSAKASCWCGCCSVSILSTRSFLKASLT